MLILFAKSLRHQTKPYLSQFAALRQFLVSGREVSQPLSVLLLLLCLTAQVKKHDGLIEQDLDLDPPLPVLRRGKREKKINGKG